MPYVNGQYVTDDEFQERGYRDEYPQSVRDPEEPSQNPASDQTYNTDASQFKDRNTAKAWFDMIGQKYGTSVDERDVDDLMRRNPEDFEATQRAYEQQYQRRGASNNMGGNTNPSDPGTSGWLPSGNTGGGGGGNDAFAQAMQDQNALFRQMMEREQQRYAEQQARLAAQEAERKAKADALYNTWLQRSQQSLNVPQRAGGLQVSEGNNPTPGASPNNNPNDQSIWNQVDLYKAAQDRATRDYMSDLAEAEGPLTNLRGERRMMAERSGQGVANYQADLISRELMGRRAEIAEALSSMAGMLSADQQIGLQREMTNLDHLIRQQQVGLGSRDIDVRQQLGLGGLENDRLRTALMERERQDQNNQFLARLGYDTADRRRYWDYMERYPRSS